MKKIYNLICAAALVCFGINQAHAQCIVGTQFPGGTTVAISGVSGATTNVTTCSYGGEFSANSFTATGNYTVVSTITGTTSTDYLTVTDNANTPIAFGITPLAFTIPTTGIYRIHVALNGPPTCGTQSSCRSINVVRASVPCAGVPSATTIANLTNPCAGATINLSSNASYTGTGVIYQWQSSTVSATGPFAPIATATNLAYSTNVLPTAPTWYQVVATCTNGPSSGTSTPVQVNPAQTTITNTVPYFQGFETPNPSAANLPNCFWSRTGDWTTATATLSNNRGPRTGVGYAYTLWTTIAGGDMLYSNGVQLNAGVTYSAEVYHRTDGIAGFTELNMSVGPNQSTLSAVSIASTAVLTNTVYTALTNTFTVPSSGIYFINFKAVAPNSAPWYLMIDDLSITAPCSLNTPVVTAASSSTAICAGSSATLTAGGATSYVWNTASTLTAIPVTPTVTTSYTVTGTNAVSCTNTAVATITVNAAPVVSIASPTAGICAGSSATLTASGANTYVWSNGAATAANAVSPAVTTVYTATGTSVAGCVGTSTSTLTVNANPVVSIAGPTTGICAGTSATLTASGANTYVWSNGPATAANAVSPTLTTVYTATGTSAAGCTGTSSRTLTVNAAPVVSIAGSTAVCAGSSATLTASGAATYTWSNGPTTAANVVTPTANVTYTAMGTSTAGCTGMTSQAVTVNALPTVSLSATASTVCINTPTIALTGSPAGGVLSGTNVAGGVFTPGSTPGTFVQTYVFTNSVTTCSNSASNSIVVSGCVGLNNVTANANGFVAYPNPTNGVFTLSFNNGLEKQITVTDVTGKVVYSTTSNLQTLDINIANLANGIYSVKVQSNQTIEVIKVVKQ